MSDDRGGGDNTVEISVANQSYSGTYDIYNGLISVWIKGSPDPLTTHLGDMPAKSLARLLLRELVDARIRTQEAAKLVGLMVPASADAAIDTGNWLESQPRKVRNALAEGTLTTNRIGVNLQLPDQAIASMAKISLSDQSARQAEDHQVKLESIKAKWRVLVVVIIGILTFIGGYAAKEILKWLGET